MNPTPTRSPRRPGRGMAVLALAGVLAACGGGDGDTSAAGSGNTGGAAGGAAVSAAPLVVSAATPGSLNGTLDKSLAQFEHGSSNALMTSYNASDDHCRVGAFALPGGNGTRYYLEISFSKASRTVGLVNFGNDTGLVLLARTAAPVAGVTVDVNNRRIGFQGVVVGAPTGSTSLTLNGSLEYPTNVDAAARAACG